MPEGEGSEKFKLTLAETIGGFVNEFEDKLEKRIDIDLAKTLGIINQLQLERAKECSISVKAETKNGKLFFALHEIDTKLAVLREKLINLGHSNLRYNRRLVTIAAQGEALGRKDRSILDEYRNAIKSNGSEPFSQKFKIPETKPGVTENN